MSTNHDHDHHLGHTEEPDPAALAAHKTRMAQREEQRAAEMNGEMPVAPGEASYDIPAPPTPEEIDRQAEARPCLSAFLIVIEEDGTAWSTNNIDMVVAPKRQPSLGDMYRSCAEVMKDIECMETSQRTVQMLAQVWPQIAAQQKEIDRQEKMATKLMQKGIHVPGRS